MNKISFCDQWVFYVVNGVVKNVSLPHDAMQESGRDKNAPSGRSEAFYLGGNYKYEKRFMVSDEWKEKTIHVEFEGVYPNATVFLNGKEIGSAAYGYSQFLVELKDLIIGQENLLEVFVKDENHPNSRWYGGAGIYRPVWLYIASANCLKPYGVKITTESIEPAKVKIETNIALKDNEALDLEIMYRDKVVAKGQGNNCLIQIDDAKLWSAEQPELYTCHLILKKNETVVDEMYEKFGVRTISWSENGLFVNGKSVLLKGGCIHHDHGILGARTFDISEWRRIQKLKEFGFNAIRSAHNPLSRSALEACDSLGMYVMDESWDTWNYTKNPYDHGLDFMNQYEEDLKCMVDKDFNHPSVIMYSIGNEVTEPAKAEGVELGKTLIEALKKLDQSRPITAGINLTLLYLASLENNPLAGGGTAPDTGNMDSTAFNKMITEMGKRMTMAAATEPADHISTPILDALDIAGYNYATSRYEMESEVHPGRIIVGSETYPIELAETWKLVEKYPYIIGDFMWTAWDYLGEVGIGSWSYDISEGGFEKEYPWLLADTGAFDILGNDNAEAGLAAVVWGARKDPYIGVSPVNHPGIIPTKAIWRGSNALPYWSYKNCEGNEAEVEVYSDAKKIELFINDRSLGIQEVDNNKTEFHLPYESGILRATAYDEKGCVCGECRLVSADPDTRISVKVEETIMKDAEIMYLNIDLVGANGQIECNQDTLLNVSVTGAELLAFGSANPKTEESFITGSYTTYYGRSTAVIRPEDSTIVVSVSGEGLEKIDYTINL